MRFGHDSRRPCTHVVTMPDKSVVLVSHNCGRGSTTKTRHHRLLSGFERNSERETEFDNVERPLPMSNIETEARNEHNTMQSNNVCKHVHCGHVDGSRGLTFSSKTPTHTVSPRHTFLRRASRFCVRSPLSTSWQRWFQLYG